jgi:hypothetical protein
MFEAGDSLIGSACQKRDLRRVSQSATLNPRVLVNHSGFTTTASRSISYLIDRGQGGMNPLCLNMFRRSRMFCSAQLQVWHGMWLS